MAFRQWHISDLITNLQKAQKRLGDLPVTVSRDEEGNGFAVLGQCEEKAEDGYNSISVDDHNKPTELILWPFDI